VEVTREDTNLTAATNDDDELAYVAAWEYMGKTKRGCTHKEPLVY
jgi:hypothetical protein